MKLWHGGSPFLEPGQLLLPPTRSGVRLTNREINGSRRGLKMAYRRDRVYATSDLAFAQVFAAIWTSSTQHDGIGIVWEVEIDDALLEHDADFPSFEGFYQAPFGVVVGIKEFMLRPTQAHIDYLEHWKRKAADTANDSASQSNEPITPAAGESSVETRPEQPPPSSSSSS